MHFGFPLVRAKTAMGGLDEDDQRSLAEPVQWAPRLWPTGICLLCHLN